MVRIPSEYQEVEWIESAHNLQYIDTGITVSEELKFIIDFAPSEHVSGRYLMGRYSNDNTSFYLYFGVAKKYQTAFGSKWGDTSLPSDTKRHKFTYEFKDGKLVVANDDNVILTKEAIFSYPQPIYVAGYALNNPSTRCKTYLSQMFKNGTLIQNLIPCYRKSDNEPGMYDTVSKTFFTNSGTGTFLVGNDVNYSTTNLLEVRRRILLNTPHIESMSGNPAIFSTDMAANLKECKIRFSPVQAGEGTPSPENVRPISGWDGVTVTRCGKNLVDVEDMKATYPWTNETYKPYPIFVGANKTATLSYNSDLVGGHGFYFVIGSNYAQRRSSGGTWMYHRNGGGYIKRKVTVTTDENGYIYLKLYVLSDADLQDFYNLILDANFQVEYGTEATSYEPYVEPQTINITFPQTIFGGYVDLIKGEVVEENYYATIDGVNNYLNAGAKINGDYCNAHSFTASGGLKNLPRGRGTHYTQLIADLFATRLGVDGANLAEIVQCDNKVNYIRLQLLLSRVGITSSASGTEVYQAINSWLEDNPLHVCYPLETPNVYSLTTQSIKALRGLNNLWSDANGNIEVKFWKH